MFTGIVEEVGKVIFIQRKANSAAIEIMAEKVLTDMHDGDSIAVNGICLTVTSHKNNCFTADIMHETMRRSSVKNIKAGNFVNLERAMAANGRFGGHIVTGHIDGTGIIKKIVQDEIAIWYTIAADKNLQHYIIEKGSAAIDGISLTVAAAGNDTFSVSVIPHTAQNTILAAKRVGDIVNIENDCIGKYIAHFLQFQEKESTVTKDFLLQNGF